MKIKQLLLLSTLLFTSTTWTMGGAREQFFKWVPRLARTTAFVGGCALPTYEYAKNAYEAKKSANNSERRNNWFKEQVEVTKSSTETGEIISVESADKYLDASDIVKNYVMKKLQEHYGDSPEGLSIRVVIDQFDKSDNISAISDLKGPLGIIFTPKHIRELTAALAIIDLSNINLSNVDDSTIAKAQTIVALNDAFLNHEIGHLKDPYCHKRNYYFTAMPLTIYTGMNIIKQIISKKFKFSTSVPGLLFSCMCILPSIFTQRFLTKNLEYAYQRQLENNADDYACQTTKDPESLKSFADLLENHGIEHFKKWVSSAHVENDLKSYTNLPLHMKALIQTIYFLENEMLPTHPLPFERAAKLRKAAQELEDKQKQIN